MSTSTITVESLVAEYAEPIASSVDLTASEYDPSAEGLASLLRDTSDRLAPMDQTADWLEGAASDLDAIARLGDDGPKTQELIRRIDSALYEAKSDLDLS
jgi:hypothetical protein